MYGVRFIGTLFNVDYIIVYWEMYHWERIYQV